MAKGIKTGGRQKGTPNKITQAAKDMIAEVAERLGGADRMLAWTQEDPANEKAFWSNVYPKLLPLQVASDPNAPLEIQLVRRVIVDKTDGDA